MAAPGFAAEIGKDCLSDVLVHEEVGDVVGDVGGPAGQALEDRLLAHDGSGGMGTRSIAATRKCSGGGSTTGPSSAVWTR